MSAMLRALGRGVLVGTVSGLFLAVTLDLMDTNIFNVMRGFGKATGISDFGKEAKEKK